MATVIGVRFRNGGDDSDVLLVLKLAVHSRRLSVNRRRGDVTDDLRMFSSNYVYFDACQNYIGTICNLDEPVTKTNSQSLKITYSITDA